MPRTSGVIPDGARLQRIRKEHGLEITELARRIGRNRRTIHRAENSEPVSDVLVYQIANALSRVGSRVTPRDFVPGWPDDDEDKAA